MRFVETIVYFGILCVHFPLKITFSTFKAGKKITENGLKINQQVSNVIRETINNQYEILRYYLNFFKFQIWNMPSTLRNIVISFFKTPSIENNSQHDTKNQYEKTFLKFQVAAFDKERVEYQKEIKRLQEELQKNINQSNNFEKERQKYDSQIKSLEEQILIHTSRFESERKKMFNELEEEKQYFRKEVLKLQNQLNKNQLDFEHISKLQVTNFDKERQQYQQDLRKLYSKINQLEYELEESRKESNEENDDENHSGNDDDHDEDNLLNPYVNDALQKIEKIKQEAISSRRSLNTFIDKEKGENSTKICEKINEDLAKLENMKVKRYRIIKKRKHETIKLLNKYLNELNHEKGNSTP